MSEEPKEKTTKPAHRKRKGKKVRGRINMFPHCSRAPGGSHREAAFLRDWLETAKKLLEAECFVFPPLLMGVFWVGDKHHDWGPLLQCLNTTVKTW